MMMQETKPDTYILATGKAHSVRDFVIMAFKAVDIELEFSGSGENEFAIDTKTKKVVLEVNPIFYRPLEVELLIGNPKKIKDKLGWESKTSLEEICKIMVEADLKRNLNNEL